MAGEMMEPGWQVFDHIADIGIRGIGKDIEQAFENGAKAMFSMMVEDLDRVKHDIVRHVSCRSFDRVGLFVAWLNELLAFSDMNREIYAEFHVKIAGNRLWGEAIGSRWKPDMHGIGIEVKGATFAEAAIKKENGLWIAQCVVDV